MSDVKICRLSTGEDVISKMDKDTMGNYTFEKPFVIIPTQSAPGKPVQLMMTPYMPYADEDVITISMDKIVTTVKPKKEILASYQQNTSSIYTPSKGGLITENKVPSL
tara:strand:+ start:143 stop:466 length:324 start_codon:yes stop_codon:yes gene_type:complete